MFAIFAGMIGTGFSVLIRLELAAPGVQFLQSDHQLFNVIISAHAFVMIFFMVKFYPYIKLYNNPRILSNNVINLKFKVKKKFNQNNLIILKRFYTTVNNKDNKEYLEIKIENPFENRKQILD